MVKVLGIAGSARRQGNTEGLLDRALTGAREAGATVEKVALVGLDLNPCICAQTEDCLPEGICSVQDEMQALYPKLLECDLLFVASPIFFRSVSAQLKAMIDRCQALWVRKYKLKQDITPHRTSPRKGLFISVANQTGTREFEGAIVVMRSFFASINARYEADLLLDKVERPWDILDRPEHLERAYDLGGSLVRQEVSGDAASQSQ
jgi:multimeric flavodoxin WrbA